jgi:hypothetical protein
VAVGIKQKWQWQWRLIVAWGVAVAGWQWYHWIGEVAAVILVLIRGV